MQTLFVWRTVNKPATRTKIYITSRISPPISEVNQTQLMQQKTSPWESMSEMRIILVMEMREGKIYPMLVLEGGFLHGNLFMKTYEPTRVMWSVPSLFSISTNNFISGMDSKGDSCCSMPCYWLISEIGKLFSACNGDFCSSGWLMNCPSDRQCLHKKKSMFGLQFPVFRFPN